MSVPHSCITCCVIFQDGNTHREHYRSDWHRYNLKRKVAELEPVTAEDFQDRVLQQRALDKAKATPINTIHCYTCNKTFNTNNAYDNHIHSKKHKQSVGRQDDDFVIVDRTQVHATVTPVPVHAPVTPVPVHAPVTQHMQEDEDEEVDSEDWEDFEGECSLIREQDCLFCNYHSKTLLKNIQHMTVAHSFFIPDPEYCTDIRGLLLYLGEKISQGYMCLWCNESGRAYKSQEAVQTHMRDKGHCKILHEGATLAEFTEFYDYSSSYPDHEDGDEDMEIDTDSMKLEPSALHGEEEYQLVLPSGATVGHRSLMRYYKQNLTGHAGAVVVRNKDDKLKSVLRQYRQLGWAPQQAEAAAKKAKDIKYMVKLQARLNMRLGVKANKLQTHFRVQCNF